MKNRIFKWVMLLLVYIAGVVVFSNISLLGRQQAVNASDLSDPTLPVVCIDVGDGLKADRLNGYVMEMDARNMRGALIPVTTSRSITLSYKSFKNRVRAVSYEVSTPDTDTIVENAKIGNFREDGEYMTAQFSLNEPILMNREYPIRFTLQTDDREIYYYARVIQRSDPITDKYVQFVYNFYEGCLNQGGNTDINTYLETDDTITNNSFTSVNIKSSLKQVTWGTLKPQIMRKAIPTVRELNGTTCSLTADYMISAEGDNGLEIYHVWEFYRLRYYNSRMMLLNFNRTALQVFRGGADGVITASGINLGVADRSVQYMSDSTSDAVAFVQDGALWEFSSGAGRLARVFSLRDVGNGTDERYDNTDYGIKIIRVSEGGGIDFAVYGYMSRGEHEGMNGISMCRYNPESSSVTEKVFIPCRKSYELMKNDLDRLCYINNSNEAYIYLDSTVYRISLALGTSSVVLTNIHPDCFVSSADSSMIAWMDEMKPFSSRILTVMSLESGSTRSITAGKRQYLKAIGFLNEDFLYGIADEKDIRTGVSGDVTFAMKTLLIEDFAGNVIKEYSNEGIWVIDVNMEPGLAQLTRAVRKNKKAPYEETTADNIINNRQNTATQVSVVLASTTRQGTTVTLKLPKVTGSLNPSVTSAKIRYAEGGLTQLEKPSDQTLDIYYVYAYGSLQDALTDPAEAVSLADSMVGVVINNKSQYVYERGNKAARTELANGDIPEAFLSGTILSTDLAEQVPENVTVMNLTGCTLDQVLYQLS
ncbi:MAG: hypothetical protein Q4G47_00800, partial [Lachnospiraceae bacterium]|nr:hypothetical protein [Lachnospiraceae bacterium]